MTVKRCKEKGLNISKNGIYCILIGKGKTRQAKSRGEVTPKKKQPPPSRTKVVVKKVKTLAIGENPGTQRAIARNVGTSYVTVKRIILLYCADTAKVWIHQDKAKRYTSRSAVAYIQQMEQRIHIWAIPFTDIPIKSPDADPMDFCAFWTTGAGH